MKIEAILVSCLLKRINELEEAIRYEKNSLEKKRLLEDQAAFKRVLRMADTVEVEWPLRKKKKPAEEKTQEKAPAEKPKRPSIGHGVELNENHT